MNQQDALRKFNGDCLKGTCKTMTLLNMESYTTEVSHGSNPEAVKTIKEEQRVACKVPAILYRMLHTRYTCSDCVHYWAEQVHAYELAKAR